MTRFVDESRGREGRCRSGYPIRFDSLEFTSGRTERGSLRTIFLEINWPLSLPSDDLLDRPASGARNLLFRLRNKLTFSSTCVQRGCINERNAFSGVIDFNEIIKSLKKEHAHRLSNNESWPPWSFQTSITCI